MAWRLRPRSGTAASTQPRDKKLRSGDDDEAEMDEAEEEDSTHILPSMTELLLKSNLQLHQLVRKMAAGLWATFMVPSSAPLVVGSDGVGKGYNTRIKEVRSGHNLGSPHAMTFLGGLEAAANEKDEAGEVAVPLRKAYASFEAKSREWVEAAVWHFTCKAVFRGKGKAKDKDKDTSKPMHIIQVGFDPLTEWDLEGIGVEGVQQPAHLKSLLKKYAEIYGGRMCTGAPPRGPIERLLKERLGKLQRAKK